MYCRHCGARVEDTDRVCGNCGALTEYGEKTEREAPTDGSGAFVGFGAREEKREEEAGKTQSERPASGAINPDGSLNVEEYRRERAERQRSDSESVHGEGYFFAPEAVTHDEDREKPRKNNIAVAGFVLAFLFPLLGIIFSAIGLKKSKETGSGKGLSIAGIVISLAMLFLYRF